jgi:D-lactate dehydrogenase (cytochrome)
VDRSARDIPAALAGLKALFGDRLSTSLAVREQHGVGFSYHKPCPADAVLFTSSTQEVQQAVRVCAKHRAPIIPYGTGTSMEGHLAALHGGICIDVSRMDRILAVHAEDMDAVVEPGVTRETLNAFIRDTGLFFSIDPGANASIGGMASTRASGTNAVRYGTMRDVVMALKVVTATGELISVGNRAKKSSTGYDLTRLYVGSEGTLGVLTEITVKLYPQPECTASAVCAFQTMRGAVDTVIQTIQTGVPAARLELLDEFSIRATNQHSRMSLKVAPTLFIEFHGSAASVKEQAECTQLIAEENGGSHFEWSLLQEERTRLWKARHESGWAAREMRPGAMNWSTDACVPISKLTENILAARADLDVASIPGRIVGHVGDGNFHVTYLIMPDSQAELAEAERLASHVVERAIESGGTASGEHGVGYGKIPHMRKEHGASVELMRAIKRALDPDDIMNPGKILPPADEPATDAHPVPAGA